MSVDREALEREALLAACSCDYYGLADAIDSVSNEDLLQIIDGRRQCSNPDCPYKMSNETRGPDGPGSTGEIGAA
jgi:hypothetical protein